MSEKQTLSLYPNPVNTEINLLFSRNGNLIVNVSILDVFGKELILRQSSELNQMTLDVEKLS